MKSIGLIYRNFAYNKTERHQEVIKINTKGLDFKHKEVINIKDAKRLGFVQDVTADLETGTIKSIIVPGSSNKFLGLFSSSNDITIPWENITCIGEDIILVDY